MGLDVHEVIRAAARCCCCCCDSSGCASSTCRTRSWLAGFIIRERVVASYSLAASLICALGVLPVRSLADLHRVFVAVTGKDIEHKPFHDQLSKAAFPELMRQVLCMLLEHLVRFGAPGQGRAR